MSRRLLRSVPRSPFSTPLSGSARETEDRIRNIFQYKKKRPPLLLFILACALALTCGGLVSCQPASGGSVSPAAGPGIAMAIQYYDTSLNYIEVPTLVPPEGGELNEAEASINRDLAELAQEYAWVQDSPGEETVYTSQQCLFYPTQTSRYLNLILFQSYGSYGTDGDIRTWCYDREEQTLVTTQQALELAGLTQDLLCSGLDQYVTDNTDSVLPDALTPVPILEPAHILGFRICGDGHVVFYLSVTTGFAPTETGGEYDPWAHLYCWDNGSLSRYDYATQTAAPLVPPEEQLDQLFGVDAPLWCQWYFNGGEPEGGFVTSSSPAPDSSEYPDGSSAVPAPPNQEPASEDIGDTSASPVTGEDYGLWNLEYSLWRDGWDAPAGLGMETSTLFFDEPGTRIERPGESLTQNEGDYWLTYEWENFSAGYYHLASDGSETLRFIDTTRTDVATWRGVRVGDSREDVLAAYPEAKSHSDQNLSLNEENCLWIAEDLEQDRGLALLFYLDGDTVRQITLTRLL